MIIIMMMMMMIIIIIIIIIKAAPFQNHSKNTLATYRESTTSRGYR